MQQANPELRQALAQTCLLGESPFWHPGEQKLWWCDIPGHRLYRFDPVSSQLDHWEFETDVGSCAPMLDGAVLLAMRDGIWRFDPASARRTRLAEAPYDSAVERFNDGKCDAQGRFWVGTIYEPRTPALAALYCFEQGRLQRRADGVTVSNGLAWSPDGSTLYWTDTKAHRIEAFDVDIQTGGLSARRPFASFAPRTADQGLSEYGGRPDGAAVDREGCYWVAMFEGARVLRLSSGGDVLSEVRLPVQCPTMVCFGGADLKTLFITTASHGRPQTELAAQPWAGSVLSLRVEVAGLPVNFFSA